MSGVEMASLALAVLPILIAAVEHVKSQRLEPRRAVFIEDLATELVSLHMSLIYLAKGLTELPDKLRKRLISSTATMETDASWRSDQVKRALKARLGQGHENFMVTLRGILDCFEQLLEKQSFDTSDTETIYTEQAFAKLRAIRDKKSRMAVNKLSQGVRFATFKADTCRKLLHKITTHNERLERVVSWSSNAQDLATESLKESGAIKNLELQLRPLLHTLHAALGGLWPCDCRREHEARLCLLQRWDRRRDSIISDTEVENVYFELLISLRSESFEPYCRWLECQICVALQQDIAPESTRDSRFEIETASSPVNTGDNVKMMSIPSPESASTTKLRRRRTPTAMQKIQKSLCQTALQANRNLSSPQILFDSGSLWHISSKPSGMNASTLSIEVNEEDTSLASLLRSEAKFRLKEKRILSVILANSLLHFCESPWLSKTWSKDHILFFSSSTGSGPDILRPYLSTTFQESDDLHMEADELYRVHPNASVLALGIMLLEIELDTPIERERSDEDFDEEGLPTVNTDHFAALRLFEGISDDLYLNSRQAIAACLNCDFYDEDTMQPSLDDYKFRQAVHNIIVRPLEQELLSAYDLTPDDINIVNNSFLHEPGLRGVPQELYDEQQVYGVENTDESSNIDCEQRHRGVVCAPLDLPEMIRDNLEYREVYGSGSVWTYTPSGDVSNEDLPLRISGHPVVIPVQYCHPAAAYTIPPPDPRQAFIDAAKDVGEDIVHDIFETYNNAIGFYLLINGMLQLIIPDKFDIEYALSHKPNEFGGLKVSYIRQSSVPTAEIQEETFSGSLQEPTNLSVAASQRTHPLHPLQVCDDANMSSEHVKNSDDLIDLKIGSMVHTCLKELQAASRFQGKIGLMTESQGHNHVVISTHILTQALTATKSNRFPCDQWKNSMVVVASSGGREIGRVTETFDPHARIFPCGFEHDVSLVKIPRGSRHLGAGLKSPLPTEWLSHDGWNNIKYTSQSLFLLDNPDLESKNIALMTSQYQMVGQAVFKLIEPNKQKTALTSYLKGRMRDSETSAKDWTGAVARSVLYRVNSSSMPPGALSGTAVCIREELEDGKECAKVAGFSSWAQPAAYTRYDIEERKLYSRLEDGRVAFFGAFQAPLELRENHRIICNT